MSRLLGVGEITPFSAPQLWLAVLYSSRYWHCRRYLSVCKQQPVILISNVLSAILRPWQCSLCHEDRALIVFSEVKWSTNQSTAWWPVDLVKTFLVTMAEYRLSTSQTILLIELYHCHDALWDFTNPLYKDRNVKSKSYQSMQMAFRDETGITLPGERAAL